MEARERAIGALSVMDDDLAQVVWRFIQESCTPKINIELVNINNSDLTSEEKLAVEAYRRGDEEYQPSISLSDFKKEMGL